MSVAAFLPISRALTAHAKELSVFDGTLVPDPNEIIDLPEGFSYRIIQRTGDLMSDGYLVPGNPDGMHCFELPDGSWALMRNHELDFGFREAAYRQYHGPDEEYRSDGAGGVTRVVLDPDTLEVRSSNLALAGTVRNCGGGPTPWGWLSCEETEARGHGYTFLVSATADSIQPPRRIDGYGRFCHEAVAFDPDTHTAYLTEDRGDSAFYRFVPDDPQQPFVGRLQALRVVGQDRYRTAYEMHTIGERLPVEWVDIPDPRGLDQSTRDQAAELGCATFRRGEGCAWHDGEVYLISTNGGVIRKGQVFRYQPDPSNPIDGGGTLELLTQSEDRETLKSPDQMTVAPWGQVFIAEDGSGEDHIRAINDNGEILDFARSHGRGELAGVCFSPDGSTMFFNMFVEGYTLAITGPFPQTNGYPTMIPTDDVPVPGHEWEHPQAHLKHRAEEDVAVAHAEPSDSRAPQRRRPVEGERPSPEADETLLAGAFCSADAPMSAL